MKIKCCPFCGETAEVYRYQSRTGNKYITVKCKNCEAQGEWEHDSGSSDEKYVINAWNNRIQSAELDIIKNILHLISPKLLSDIENDYSLLKHKTIDATLLEKEYGLNSSAIESKTLHEMIQERDNTIKALQSDLKYLRTMYEKEKVFRDGKRVLHSKDITKLKTAVRAVNALNELIEDAQYK